MCCSCQDLGMGLTYIYAGCRDGLCIFVPTPCLNTFWHAVPTSLYIFNVFITFIYSLYIEVQYIGETENPLHVRMNDHCSDIHTKKLDEPVSAHFSQPDHSVDDLQVCGIEQIHHSGSSWRKQRESYWIFELRTLSPHVFFAQWWRHHPRATTRRNILTRGCLLLCVSMFFVYVRRQYVYSVFVASASSG